MLSLDLSKITQFVSEEEMNKPDPKQDSFEQNINEAINNIDEIMGGSDR